MISAIFAHIIFFTSEGCASLIVSPETSRSFTGSLQPNHVINRARCTPRCASLVISIICLGTFPPKKYHDDAGRIRILEIRANLGGTSKHIVQLLVCLGIPHARVLPKIFFFVYRLCEKIVYLLCSKGHHIPCCQPTAATLSPY